MKYRIFWTVVSMLVVLGLLAGGFGCAQPAAPATTTVTATAPAKTVTTTVTAAPAAPKVFKFSISWPEVYTYSNGLVPAMKDTEEFSGGRIKFDPYWSSTLFSQKEALEALTRGAIEMSSIFPGSYEELVPAGSVSSLPFVVPDVKSIADITRKGLWAQYLGPEYEAAGVQFITFFEADPYAFAMANKLIKTPSDLEGVKIRVSGKVLAYWMALTGAAPVVMPFSEVYMAMKLGTIDGVMTAEGSMFSRKIQENTKYFSNDGICQTGVSICMNNDAWNGLPADLQGIMVDTFNTRMADNQLAEATQGRKNWLEYADANGIETYELTDSDRDAFKEVTAPANDWFLENYNIDPSVFKGMLALFDSYK